MCWVVTACMIWGYDGLMSVSVHSELGQQMVGYVKREQYSQQRRRGNAATRLMASSTSDLIVIIDTAFTVGEFTEGVLHRTLIMPAVGVGVRANYFETWLFHERRQHQSR